MSIEEFVDKYKPVTNEDDEIYQFDWTTTHEWNVILKAHKEKKLCTVVDSENEMILIEGLHYANKLFYVITENVINEELSIIY